jgi:hypothetical protein
MYRHAPHEAAGRRIDVAGFALAARRWWPVVVTAALLGGLLGMAATSHPTYSSTLLVRVLALTSDGIGFENASQTALQLMQSDEVFQRAAEVVGGDSGALRTRTAVTRITETDLLEVNVSAPSADQAKREATSIASAGRELMQDLSEEQVAAAALSSDRAVVSGVLPNGAAELARQQELGKSAAARQDVGLATAISLSPVGSPDSVRSGLSRSFGAAIGIVAGALLGIGGAWAFGRRFGRLRRVGDVRTILPGARVVERRGLAGIAHRYSDRSRSLISVLALPEAGTALPELTTTLVAELRTDGRRPYVLEAADVGEAVPGAANATAQIATVDVFNDQPSLNGNGTAASNLRSDLGTSEDSERKLVEVLGANGNKTSDASKTAVPEEGPSPGEPAASGEHPAAEDPVPGGHPAVESRTAGEDAASGASDAVVKASPRPRPSPWPRSRPKPQPQPSAPSEEQVVRDGSSVLTAEQPSTTSPEAAASADERVAASTRDEQNSGKSTAGHEPGEPTNGYKPVDSTNGHNPIELTNGRKPVEKTAGHEPMETPNGHQPLETINGHKATTRSIPTIGRRRDRDLAAVGCDTLLVSGSWERGVAARLADRADVVLLVAKQGVTRLHDLRAAGRDLGDTDVVVVVVT